MILDFRSSTFDYEIPGLVTVNEDGDKTKGEPTWVEYLSCNIVPAGQANSITLPDGTTETYSYTIHTSTECREFKYGDKVRLHIIGGVGIVKSVKGFQRYQLQTKIWV